MWDVLSRADLVKLSREELDYLAAPLGTQGENAVIARLLGAQARVVVVTDGAAAVRWHTRRAQGAVGSFRVRTVDTTAAGDAFVGGLLFRLGEIGGDGDGLAAVSEQPTALEDAIRFGAAVGALAVTRQGAFAAMPSLGDVHQLLQQQETAA